MARGPGGTVLKVRWLGPVVVALAPHPSLWATAARQARILVPTRWWRRRPFLPVPSAEYLQFRLETAYGGAGDQPPDPGDLVTYLRWCRTFPG